MENAGLILPDTIDNAITNTEPNSGTIGWQDYIANRIILILLAYQSSEGVQLATLRPIHYRNGTYKSSSSPAKFFTSRLMCVH